MLTMYHIIAYGYHQIMRRFHKRKGKWQTADFERHHIAMKYHKERMLIHWRP
jgi:hypothetical protein